MSFAKSWKNEWNLKSLTKDQLFNIIQVVISKQLEEIEPENIKLSDNLLIDYEADSVDVIAMLLVLEDIFKSSDSNNRMTIPTDKLSEVVFVEDILDIMYEVLLNTEKQMNSFNELKPDLSVIKKRQKN
jgi:acyl carrier protein